MLFQLCASMATTTQPRPHAADTASMIIAPIGFRQMQADFEAAILWGELQIAAGHQVDPFPSELDALAAAFFAIFRPIALA